MDTNTLLKHIVMERSGDLPEYEKSLHRTLATLEAEMQEADRVYKLASQNLRETIEKLADLSEYAALSS
jgi:hypothetical protein